MVCGWSSEKKAVKINVGEKTKFGVITNTNPVLMRLGWNGPQWGIVLTAAVSSCSFFFFALVFGFCRCWRRQTSALFQPGPVVSLHLDEVWFSPIDPGILSRTDQLLADKLCLCVWHINHGIPGLLGAICLFHFPFAECTILWKTDFLSGLVLYLPVEWSFCDFSQLPCKLLGPMSPAFHPCIYPVEEQLFCAGEETC